LYVAENSSLCSDHNERLETICSRSISPRFKFRTTPVQVHGVYGTSDHLTRISRITVHNRDYHYLPQSEMDGGKRISQNLSGLNLSHARNERVVRCPS